MLGSWCSLLLSRVSLLDSEVGVPLQGRRIWDSEMGATERVEVFFKQNTWISGGLHGLRPTRESIPELEAMKW